MRAAFLLAAAAALAALPAQAAETVARVSAASEQLSNGSPGWREVGVGMQLRYGPRQVLDLAGADVHRFGLHDSQFAASYSLPLSNVLTATVEGNASATHRVLARHAFGAALQFEFAPAWLLHGGARTSKYDSGTVNGFQVALEHYFSSWSVLLGWRPTRAFGETVHSAELRANHYYGERNAIGLIAAGGEEAASVPGGVVLTDVRSLALTGRHWVNPRWALTWGASYARQGSLYTRKGLNAGVQYVF
ncbi:YaiO family outer membrane beta-barrel protein [Massilia niabensis]|uniref:YaiO family outer membrane beta-barrel protein n=1 Tax=Massilia niabensis TaxID=544910 RepID=A0ABW0L8L8_9BURK